MGRVPWGLGTLRLIPIYVMINNAKYLDSLRTVIVSSSHTCEELIAEFLQCLDIRQQLNFGLQ